MDRLASFAGCQSRSAYLLRQTATCTLALFALTFLQVTHGASTGPGAVVNDEMCMQEQAGFELNCTANDVRISGIADVSGPMGVPDGIIDENDIAFLPVCDAMASNAGADCSTDPNICMADGSPAPQLCGDRCGYPGDTTRFSTTFIFELSAQERHDVAAYFETAR